MSRFDSDGYRTVKFIKASTSKSLVVTNQAPKNVEKKKKDLLVEAINSRSNEDSHSSQKSSEVSESENESQSPPHTPKILRESVEEDDTADITLFAKYKVYESGSTSTRCTQIEIDSDSTIGDMKNAFYEAIGVKKPNMKFYHISYSNGMKFGLGDIKKEDGKIGRWLDPSNDSNLLSKQKIENGSMFEIEIPK